MQSFHKNKFKWANLALLLFVATFVLSACGNDDEDARPNNNNPVSDAALIIETGARSVDLGGATFTYSAKLVYADGRMETPTGVQWSVKDAEVADINASSGAVTLKSTGATYVTATLSRNNQTLTAQAPLRVSAPQASLFVVYPWAVIGQSGDSHQFNAVYANTGGGGGVQMSYTSSNTNVATVTSGGALSLVAAGECVITATGTFSGQTVTQAIPVLVVGGISAPLPVTRVKVTPAAADIFRNETVQLSAQAFNSANSDVSNAVTFSWATNDASVASVSNTGLVSAVGVGETTIRVTANGISAEAFISVQPDTVLLVTPFMYSLGGGATKQFTATVYNNRTGAVITGVPITWEVPSFGPGLEMFNVGTVNQSGLFTASANATPGMAGFVVAYATNNPEVGAASVVTIAIGGGGGCGAENPNVASVAILNSANVGLSMFGGQLTHQIQAEARNAAGQAVQGVALNFNSSNEAVASVDSDGTITAVGQGSATITVCVGSEQATVNVTVSF